MYSRHTSILLATKSLHFSAPNLSAKKSSANRATSADCHCIAYNPGDLMVDNFMPLAVDFSVKVLTGIGIAGANWWGQSKEGSKNFEYRAH